VSVDLRYSFKLPFALLERHSDQGIVTPPSRQSEAMRKNYKEIIFPVLCVMVIFPLAKPTRSVVIRKGMPRRVEREYLVT